MGSNESLAARKFPPEKIFRSHLGTMQGVGTAYGSLPIPYGVAVPLMKRSLLAFSESSVDLSPAYLFFSLF